MNDVSQVVLVYPSPRMSFDRSNQLVAKALWICLTERILFLINCELRNVYSTHLKPMRACALFSQSRAILKGSALPWIKAAIAMCIFWLASGRIALLYNFS